MKTYKNLTFSENLEYNNKIMAKRKKGIVPKRKIKSKKTKKRLEIKRLMLEAKAKKGKGKK